MVAIRQNLRRKQTRSSSTSKHGQSHNQATETAWPDVRPGKASGTDRMAKSKRPPKITRSSRVLLYESEHSSSSGASRHGVSCCICPFDGNNVGPNPPAKGFGASCQSRQYRSTPGPCAGVRSQSAGRAAGSARPKIGARMSGTGCKTVALQLCRNSAYHN